MNNFIKVVLSLVAVLSFYAFSGSNESLEDRIKPVGDIYMAPESSEARSGEKVYTSTCAGCHASGAAGAPKLGDVADWQGRLGKGLDTLYASAISGFNSMPAMGACFDCSDEELKAAVDYILENSK